MAHFWSDRLRTCALSSKIFLTSLIFRRKEGKKPFGEITGINMLSMGSMQNLKWVCSQSSVGSTSEAYLNDAKNKNLDDHLMIGMRLRSQLNVDSDRGQFVEA